MMRFKSWFLGAGNVLLFGVAGLVGLEYFGLNILAPVRTRVVEVGQMREMNRDLALLQTDQQVLGDHGGSRTVLMFTDYQCPFCRRQEFALDSLRERIQDLRVVVQYYPLPFHAQAKPAAVAAICAARQGRFRAAHRVLYDQLHSHASLDVAVLAETVEIPSTDDFETCLHDAAIMRQIDSTVAIAQRIGVRGTPSFIIHGRLHRGMMSAGALHAALTDAKE